MKRVLFFGYGVGAHLLFLVTYAWLAAFVGNLALAHTVDGPERCSFWTAVAIDGVLVAVFGVQHSVMARPWFKRRWTRVVPEPIERSTYVLASCAALGLLMWQWRPVGVVVWDVSSPAARWVAWGLFAGGWLMVPLVSLMISHTDLFGIRQVWLYLRGEKYTYLPFRTPGLYARMRHPLYVGWFIALWATPTMTGGHLLLAAALSSYIMLAVVFEEHDLVAHFGQEYEEYQKRVPKFIPRLAVYEPSPEASALRRPSAEVPYMSNVAESGCGE